MPLEIENFKIKLLQKNVYIPSKNNLGIISFYNTDNQIIILPQKREIISLGYDVFIDSKFCMILQAEQQISKLNGLILLDTFVMNKIENFRLTFYNISDTKIVLKPKQKIAEGFVFPIAFPDIQVVKNI